MSTEKPNRGYGKHSVRFWVTVYLTAGIVLYTAAYVLFAHHGGASGSGANYGY